MALLMPAVIDTWATSTTDRNAVPKNVRISAGARRTRTTVVAAEKHTSERTNQQSWRRRSTGDVAAATTGIATISMELPSSSSGADSVTATVYRPRALGARKRATETLSRFRLAWLAR